MSGNNSNTYKPILCLDFDGVIHSYSSGWKGADVIPDPIVPGTADFLLAAVDIFDVQIFSSRSHQENAIFAMQDWLEIELGKELENAYYIVSRIKFPKEKPPAMITIDDRAITFTGTWPTCAELLAFKPWNKRG